MRKATAFLVFTLLVTPVSSWAAGEAATFLRILTDPRSAAMAGATCAIVNNTGALSVNPAGLGLMSAADITFTHDQYVADLALEHAAFGGKAGDLGLAGGFDYVNYGSIPTSNAEGTSTGSVSPQSMIFTFGAGTELTPNFIIGAMGKYFTDNTATGGGSSDGSLSGGAGMMYRNANGFSAGAAVLNAGGLFEGFALPLQTSVGLSYRRELLGDAQAGPEAHVVIFSGQWDYYPNTDDSTLSVAGEYTYHHFIAARLGYRFAAYGDSDGLDGLSAGIGLRLDEFLISYALTEVGALGTNNEISLSVRL
jgi:hypothetical protein